MWHQAEQIYNHVKEIKEKKKKKNEFLKKEVICFQLQKQLVYDNE